MLKTIKFVTSLFVLAGFIGFLTIGYYAKQENPTATAQEFGDLECSGPIVPNGDVSEDVIKLVNIVFKEYQKSAMNLKAAISHSQILWASLSQNNDVCDFSKCEPKVANNSQDRVGNSAPGFALTLNAYIVKGEVGIRPPFCNPGEAVGDPCFLGDIRSDIEQLKILTSGFSAGYETIHKTFSTVSEMVTEDTRIKANDYLNRPEEPVGKLITKQEEIRRKMEAVEGLLDLCTLSALEREMVEDGKMGERKVEKCINVLRSGQYKAPKPWSEACIDECSSGPTEWCTGCLGECEGTSVLAKLNCRIYSTKTGADTPKNCSNGKDPSCCGDVCKDNYNSFKCDECLSRGLSGTDREAWLCGGHPHNWICCSAVPLENTL